MTTIAEVVCPKCGGTELWDNRATKRNPKAPDFRCKNDGKNGRVLCDGVVWLPKTGNGAAPATQSMSKQAFSQGPHIPGMDDATTGNYTGQAAPTEATPAAARLAGLFKLHAACITHAVNVANEIEEQHRIKADLCGISALAAQVFIAATKNGV